MDYWCALWFWPIEKADLLPSRDEYLMDLQLIIEGNVIDNIDIRVTVLTKTIWGWVGIGIVVLVIIGLFAMFMRLGRR